MKKFIMMIIMITLMGCQKDDNSKNITQVNSIAEITWPKSGGDLRNTNRSKEIRPMDVYPGPQLGQIAWQVDMGGSFSSPSIDSGGVIYAASYWNGKLCAISSSGSVLWTGPVGTYWGDIAVSSSGNIYACNSYLRAISSEGTVNWSYRDGTSKCYNPVVGPDSTIYVASASHMTALNPDGSVKWQFQATCGDYTSAVLCNDRIYFNGYTAVYAITINGTLIWKYDAQLPEKVVVDASSNIYFHSRMSTWITCIDRKGRLKWQLDYMTIEGRVIDTHSVPALDKDGRVYTAFSNFLHAFESDGTMIWTFVMPKPVGISSPVIDSEGNIFICTYHDGSAADSSYIYKVSRDGKEIWHLGVPGYDFDSTPAIGPDGKMYVGTNADSKGYLLAIE